MSSSLTGITIKCTFSSAGRALVLHARCHRFDSYRVYNMPVYTVSGSGADCKSVVFRLGWFDSICWHNKDLKLKWYKLPPVKRKILGSSPIRSATTEK